VATVTTFGQPKVTNFEGANSLNHLDIKRIVLPNDLVPLIPPFDPLDIQNLDIYWHAGKELILLKDKQYTIVEGVDAMLRATKFTQEPLNEGNLVNHKMSIYRQAVNKKTPLAKQVAYENNFNLFNLFGGDTPEPATSQ
ncbi:MAG: triacylglycerol lipase, partial [Gammaproteobacteria bacterium]